MDREIILLSEVSQTDKDKHHRISLTCGIKYVTGEHIYKREALTDIKNKLMVTKGVRGYQIRSVAQSCPTLCDAMNRSTPGLPVHHQLPEFTQTHVHRVGDAIQPSHPLSSPSPPAPNPSQHQSLFQ